MRLKSIAFILTVLLSWTASLGQDTAIEIPYLVAREIAADLVRYDSALVELERCDLRIQHLEGVVATKNEIIRLYSQNASSYSELELSYIESEKAYRKEIRKLKTHRAALGLTSIVIIILALI